MYKFFFISIALFNFLYAYNTQWKTWEYDGKFHKIISQADRIVVRDGGYGCCNSVDEDMILIELTTPKDIANFNQSIQFVKKALYRGDCMCCGHPGIDWYRGKEKIALTAIRHGQMLSWKGFPFDVRFTKKSTKQLAAWFIEKRIFSNGVFLHILNKSDKETLLLLITSLKSDTFRIKLSAAHTLRFLGKKAQVAVPTIKQELQKLDKKYNDSYWWKEVEEEREKEWEGNTSNDQASTIANKKVIPLNKKLDAKLRRTMLSVLAIFNKNEGWYSDENEIW